MYVFNLYIYMPITQSTCLFVSCYPPILRFIFFVVLFNCCKGRQPINNITRLCAYDTNATCYTGIKAHTLKNIDW